VCGGILLPARHRQPSEVPVLGRHLLDYGAACDPSLRLRALTDVTCLRQTNLTAASDCWPCPAGLFCVAGTSIPTACYDGTYASSTGTPSASTLPFCEHRAGLMCLAASGVLDMSRWIALSVRHCESG
jgi:hypothetical protein